MKEMGFDLFREQFADSPDTVAFLEANFCDAPAGLIAALLEGADESDFSLREWVEALRVLSHWLDTHGLLLPLSDQIGYVSCASEAAGVGANLTHLPSLVSEMLEAYGCERAVKK
jgi:hypothetical protein